MKQIKAMAVLLTTAFSMIGVTAITSIPDSYADANCDQAGEGTTFPGDPNRGGNHYGNAKQCPDFDDPTLPKEPVRNCDSTQDGKDNDGDGTTHCKVRGANEGSFP